jgi:UDP-N-acetyl-2-amino-2-deoxyglucuronate dehydrogenase
LGLLGEIRGMSMVQRWQRPYEYFSGWRAQPDIGGGTLYECGIHYLDVMNELLGTPKIISSKVYATKHKTSQIEDTIYSLLDFGNYGGTVEVTVSAEPHNLECSLSIMGSNGYIKLGGKAMNIIESANFLSNGCRVEYENLLKSQNIPNAPNSYGSYAGSCPNHSELYENLENFPIISALKSIEIIDEIYNAAGVRYY